MYLKAVELRDWRSYRHARFEFPAPKGRRNVILIRGPNEHGKKKPEKIGKPAEIKAIRT